MEAKFNTISRKKSQQDRKYDQLPMNRTPGYVLLWILVLLLLAFNLTLGWFLIGARQQIMAFQQIFSTRLVQTGIILENIKGASIDYVAKIDQVIPISVDIPLDYMVEVPVNMVVPINTTVSIPLLGENGPSIDVPISTEVPISTTIRVPIRMSVPVKTDMPIKMDIPVAIKISDTFLVHTLDETQVLLAQLSLDLGSLLKELIKFP